VYVYVRVTTADIAHAKDDEGKNDELPARVQNHVSHHCLFVDEISVSHNKYIHVQIFIHTYIIMMKVRMVSCQLECRIMLRTIVSVCRRDFSIT